MTYNAELAIPNSFTALVLGFKREGTKEDREISALCAVRLTSNLAII